MTLGLMSALHELSLRCPENISVLGFDDFEQAREALSRTVREILRVEKTTR